LEQFEFEIPDLDPRENASWRQPWLGCISGPALCSLLWNLQKWGNGD